MAIRFISKATIKNKLPRSSNIWDGTAVYNPFTLVGNYDALSTVTVPSGGLSSITFAGIPTTGYTHLQIRAISKTNRTSATVDSLKIQFNGDTATNYAYHELIGDGASALSDSVTSNAYAAIARTAGNANTSFFGGFTCDILDYANTNKYKTVRTLSGVDLNGSGAVFFNSGLWRSTSAITSILIAPETGTLFSQYSSFALYGVK